MRWPSSAGTTVWQGRALQRDFGRKALAVTGCGRNDGAGGAKFAGRFLRGCCGAGIVVAGGVRGRKEKPPDPEWAGGLSLLVALDAKLAVSACL